MRALTVVFALLIGIMIAVGLSVGTPPDQGLPPCELEDGSTQQACVWHGAEYGNGKGRSYISRDYGRTITPIEE